MKTLLKVLCMVCVLITPSVVLAEDSSSTDLSAITDLLIQILLAEQATAQQTGVDVGMGSVSNYTHQTDEDVQALLSELRDTEWAALTKNYGASKFSMEENESWSQDDWDDLLAGADSDKYSEIATLMDTYQSKYPVLEAGKPDSVSVDNLVGTTYTQEAETYRAGLATSQYSYNQINDRIAQLQSLLAKVDDDGYNVNEKASLDLNSRIAAEVGFIQLEMMRLQSIALQVQSTREQSQLNAETIDKKFTHYEFP